MTEEQQKRHDLNDILSDLLNSTGPVKRRVAPEVQVRKRIQPQIPEWQKTLAQTYLLVPDMGNTTDPNLENENSKIYEQPISEETISCICHSTHESEIMLQCDSCKRWMHVTCVRLQDSQEDDTYICIFCQYQLSKAVKQYIRNKVSNLQDYLKPLVSDLQNYRIPQSQNIWKDLTEHINELQNVLQIIPSYFPSGELGSRSNETNNY